VKNGNQGIVGEIMTGSPVTLRPDDTLNLANDLIFLGRIRHIPVAEGSRLVGIISERDLLGAAAERLFGLKPKARSALLRSVLVRDIMKRRVVTAEPDTPITRAAHLMAANKIGCLPVVSEGALVGLVTSTDILRYVEGRSTRPDESSYAAR